MTLIPSFVIILIVKEFWLIINLSFNELRHLSMMLIPSSWVMFYVYYKFTLVYKVSITLLVKYSAYPWAALVNSTRDPK